MSDTKSKAKPKSKSNFKSMAKTKGFFVTTLIGGAAFLVPFVVAVLVIEKAIGYMKVVAGPLAKWVAVDTFTGVALANLIALLAVVGVCFVAGLFARGAWVRKTFAAWENAFLMKIPGYALVKGVKDVFDPETSGTIRPAVFLIDDVQCIGFEIERVSGSRSVVYLPGTPNTFSGQSKIIASENVTYLDVSVGDVMDYSQSYGIGAEALLSKAISG